MSKLQTEYPKLVEAQKQVNSELPEWDKTQPFIDAIKLLSQNLQETVDSIENAAHLKNWFGCLSLPLRWPLT